jgi:hypothetical protein
MPRIIQKHLSAFGGKVAPDGFNHKLEACAAFGWNATTYLI